VTQTSKTRGGERWFFSGSKIKRRVQPLWGRNSIKAREMKGTRRISTKGKEGHERKSRAKPMPKKNVPGREIKKGKGSQHGQCKKSGEISGMLKEDIFIRQVKRGKSNGVPGVEKNWGQGGKTHQGDVIST